MGTGDKLMTAPLRYSAVYGGIAGGTIIVIISAVLAMDAPRHFESTWFGYLVMLAALSLIFVGVKRYRDVECGGVIRFGRAFALGLGMAAVAGATYVAGWELFLAATGRDFMADYSASVIDNMRADGATPAAIEATRAELRVLAVKYRDPLFRIPVTFIEIFPVGLVVAFVSAALLRNMKFLPAHVVTQTN